MTGGAYSDVTVTFTDDPEPYTSHATVNRVTRAIHSAADLEARLVGKDWAVGRSKDFVQKVRHLFMFLENVARLTKVELGVQRGE